ncbi:MAG TPA: HAMP domain-containing sensor histidine kinase [Verrucomicrobiae bacterium]|nr:HAMP domain-containing sensor histidine kinase [Verrucomicrobiae bacterium]
MKRLARKIFSPLNAFIGIQVVWILTVGLWIYRAVARHREFGDLARRYSLQLTRDRSEWLTLAQGLILLAAVLAGVYILFLYWRRQSKLYQQQRDFISSVAHELKSPLASIRLHLETIRLRRPDPQRLEQFLDTMISDTERLDGLITNLLMAARLEHGRRSGDRPVVDLSEGLVAFLEKNRGKIPEGGVLEWEVEKGLHLAAEQEALETAFRNLFENAILYSDLAPELTVTARREGKSCVILFADRGRGLDHRDLARVFEMFQRVRRSGENIRGTGLGLYIVKSVVEEHGGKVAAESPGPGKGSVFRITLPLAERSDNG